MNSLCDTLQLPQPGFRRESSSGPLQIRLGPGKTSAFQPTNKVHNGNIAEMLAEMLAETLAETLAAMLEAEGFWVWNPLFRSLGQYAVSSLA